MAFILKKITLIPLVLFNMMKRGRDLEQETWLFCPSLKEVRLWTSPNVSELLFPPLGNEDVNTCSSYYTGLL